jgi:hypothetical protein
MYIGGYEMPPCPVLVSEPLPAQVNQEELIDSDR